MPFLDDKDFQDSIKMRIENQTPAERIIKTLIICATIVIIVLLFYWSDKNNIEYQLELKTTREQEFKLIKGKWIEVHRFEKQN